MSLEYIRNHYDVPANRGQRVVFLGAQDERRLGRIVGACGAYLRVRFDGEQKPRTLHPTWRVEYLERHNVGGNRLAPTQE